jgi:3-hydroxypropanoate dehydrogenase
MERLDDASLDLIFREARTLTRWTGRDVTDDTLRAVWSLARMGPTSANCSPMRILFVKSDAAKARLRPHLSGTNVEQTMTAPVTAVIAYDLAFCDLLPRLFSAEAVGWFKGKPHEQETAFRNGTLQGAYVMLAARALGLDCGPMSGFRNAGVDAEFFAGTSLRSNFLVNLGYGDRTGLEPRNPRLAFDEACTIA